MGIDSKLVLPHAKRLYMITQLREITTGNSGDSIFEAKTTQQQYILKISEYSEKNKSHMEFASRWTEYLSSRMKAIAKPAQSREGRLYEVIEASGKRYILSLQEKAPGKNCGYQ